MPLDDRRKPSGPDATASYGRAAGDYPIGHFVPGPDVTILGILGRGGFSTVYLAQRQDGRLAALKVIHPHLARKSSVTNSMLEEAETLKRIDHPNVVRFLDCGWTADAQYRVYILMERLEGASGRQILQEKGGMLIQHALDVGISLLMGLEAVHAKDIIHRDLKPDNVFVHIAPSGEPFAKLYDFGIQQRRDRRLAEDPDGTRKFEGTVAYAAPEQLFGEVATVRTDIFAFGVLLFEWLTGKHPHEQARLKDEDEHVGDDLDSSHLVHAILNKQPSRLSDYLLVPHELEEIVAKCLAIAPEHRYDGVGPLRRDLEDVRKNLTPDFIKSKKTTQQYLIAAVQAVRQARADASPNASSNERPIAVELARADWDSDIKQRRPVTPVPPNITPAVAPRAALDGTPLRSLASPTPPSHAVRAMTPAASLPAMPFAGAGPLATSDAPATTANPVQVHDTTGTRRRRAIVAVTSVLVLGSCLAGVAVYQRVHNAAPVAVDPSSAHLPPSSAVAPTTAVPLPVASVSTTTGNASGPAEVASATSASPGADAPVSSALPPGSNTHPAAADNTRPLAAEAGRTAQASKPAKDSQSEKKRNEGDRSDDTRKAAPSGASGSVADQARALMLKEPDAARRLLETRINGKRFTQEEIGLLETICKNQNDQTCLTRCKERRNALVIMRVGNAE